MPKPGRLSVSSTVFWWTSTLLSYSISGMSLEISYVSLCFPGVGTQVNEAVALEPLVMVRRTSRPTSLSPSIRTTFTFSAA